MPPYPKMFRIYSSTCVPILVLLDKFEQLVCYAAELHGVWDQKILTVFPFIQPGLPMLRMNAQSQDRLTDVLPQCSPNALCCSIPAINSGGCPTGHDILRVWLLMLAHGRPYSDFRHTPQREPSTLLSPTTNTFSLVCKGDCYGLTRPRYLILTPKAEKYPSLVKISPMRQHQNIYFMLAQWQLHTVSLETCMSGQGLKIYLSSEKKLAIVAVPLDGYQKKSTA